MPCLQHSVWQYGGATNIFSTFCSLFGFSSSLTFFNLALVLIIIFCNFTQQQLRADDFQMPPHRQAVAVACKPRQQFLKSWRRSLLTRPALVSWLYILTSFDIGFFIGSCGAGQQTPSLTSGFAGRRLQTSVQARPWTIFSVAVFWGWTIIFCGALLPWLLIAFFWVNIFVLTRLAGSKDRTGFNHSILVLSGLDTVLNGNFGCSFFRSKIRFSVDNWPCDDQI